MSSSIGSNDASFGKNPPGQVSPPAFEGDSMDQGETGGAVKASQILGSVGAASGALGAVAPFTAPITVPLGILTGLAGSIAGIFGGGLTQAEVDMLGQIKNRVDMRRNIRGVTGSPL